MSLDEDLMDELEMELEDRIDVSSEDEEEAADEAVPTGPILEELQKEKADLEKKIEVGGLSTYEIGRLHDNLSRLSQLIAMHHQANEREEKHRELLKHRSEPIERSPVPPLSKKSTVTVRVDGESFEIAPEAAEQLAARLRLLERREDP